MYGFGMCWPSPSATSDMPISSRKDRARILIVGWSSTKSEIGPAATIMTMTAMTTAATITGTCSAMPMAVITWMYGWYFLWRHLVVPKPSASDQLDQLLNKSRAFRWNVETIGFSPNGFNAYFLFKVLIVVGWAPWHLLHPRRGDARRDIPLQEGEHDRNR